MGLCWQQGPLSPGAIGRFLVPEPLPKRLLYAEPLRRRMRVRFGGSWIVDSEDVLLLFEPGHYPMAYFREIDVTPGTLERSDHTTRHPDLGPTSWYTVRAGDKSSARGAWQHTDLPSYAHELRGRVAFAWPAMDAFYEEDESSTDQSRSTNLLTATFSFAAHNRFAMSSSICEAASLRAKVEDQGGADQAEADARRDERNQHSGREARKHTE
jgi:uncharacterized protein (DUF427 family)